MNDFQMYEEGRKEAQAKQCDIPCVMPSAYGIFSYDTGNVYGYYRTKEDAESILSEQCDETWYVDELNFTEMCEGIDPEQCDEQLFIQLVSNRTSVDFKKLRDAYFKEHVTHKTTDGIPMVCTHPHNLFEWFKAELKEYGC